MYLDDEFLVWKERMFDLCKKYKETPPGFRSAEEESQALEALRLEREDYEARHSCRLEGGYQAAQEQFVGRTNYLKEIHRCFAEEGGPVILYGIGGIGKTALAREYIRRYQDDYDTVQFLYYQGSFQTLICDDVQLPISNLKYSPDKYGNKSRYFGEKLNVLAQLARETRLLLVIDDCNVEFDSKMEQIFSLPCRILVTTRVNPKIWGGYRGLRVKGLETEEEWEAFIRIYRGREPDPEERKELLEYRKKVNGHTLSMMLKAKGAELETEMSGRMARDMFSRFRLSREEKQALRELSIMPVQGIGRKLYLQVSRTSDQTLDRLIARLLVRQEQRGEEGDAALSMHPLIAQMAGMVFSPSLANCYQLIQGFYTRVYDAWNDTYLENQRLEPYVFALLSAFPRPVAWLSRQLDGLVTFLWIQGYYREAEAYCKKIVGAAEQYYGLEHQITGEMYIRLAAVYYNSMDFSQAQGWYEKGYRVLRTCPPFDQRYYYSRYTASSKMSRSCRFQGDYERALTLLQESMDDIERFRDATRAMDPQAVAGNWEMMYQYAALDKAKIFLKLGRTAEAEALCRDSLEAVLKWQERNKEEDFRDNEFRGVLVEILLKQGAYEEAEAMCRAMVDKAVRYRGRYFKDTLSCREQLADVYAAAGKDQEARQEYGTIRQCLTREYPYQKEWISRVCRKEANVKVHIIDEKKSFG